MSALMVRPEDEVTAGEGAQMVHSKAGVACTGRRRMVSECSRLKGETVEINKWDCYWGHWVFDKQC